MDTKELSSAVGIAGELLKNLEPMLKRAEKWSQLQRLAAAIVSLAVVVLLLSGTLPVVALTAFVLVIVAISLLAIKRRIIEAQVFITKDKKGKKRAMFGLSDAGEPYLAFFDPNERPQGFFGIPAELGSPTLHLIGSDGKSYLQCYVSKQNESHICVGPILGAHSLVSSADDLQSIAIVDKQNKLRAEFHGSEKYAVVRLTGKGETKASAELGVYDEKPVALLNHGESGKPIVLLGTKEDGSGKLDLFDNNGGLIQRVP
jgi:hypothetical protein